MALSETFNLDFKFGGNVELLARLENLLNRIDSRFDSVEDSVNDAAKATDNMADKVDDLNDSFKEGVGAMGEFGEKLKDIAQYYLSFQAIRAGAERVWSFGMESMDAFSTQERAENQLKGVMKNRGTLADFQAIKDYAATIQGRSIYGDEAMIRGAGELATYVKGTESLKAMMNLLTDYAAGMTGGGEVSPEQMESLATGLGMAYDGNYMAMRRKGFDTSKLEALDAIVENGGVWGAKERKKYGDVLDDETIKQIRKYKGVTEQMRVDALKESLSDWKGLSDAVNDLDSSALIRFNNKLGDLRENIGKRLYPTFNKLVDAIDKHMPDIEGAFQSVADVFETMAETLEKNMDLIKDVVFIFSKLLTVVAKFPRGTLAAAIGLKALSNGALSASGKFGSLATQMGRTVKEMFQMNKAGMALAGGAGVAAGMTADVGAGNSNGSNIAGTLGAMAMGAAAGAAQFGLMGAAIGAAAASLTILVKGIYEYIEAENAKDNREKNQKDMDAAWDKMMSARKLWKSNTTNKGNYKERYDTYVEAAKDYREFTGGLLPDYIQKEMFVENRQKEAAEAAARQAEKDGKKNGKVDIANTYNNTYIDQKVNVAAEVEKIGMLLNFSVRAAIVEAMKKNQNQMAVGEI